MSTLAGPASDDENEDEAKPEKVGTKKGSPFKIKPKKDQWFIEVQKSTKTFLKSLNKPLCVPKLANMIACTIQGVNKCMNE